MTSHGKKTPEQATLGSNAPGDPERMEHARVGPRYLDVPVAYEKTDMVTGPVLRVGGILAAVALLSVGVTYGVFRAYGSLERKDDPPPPPLARAAGRQFPEPRLQTTPVQDHAAVRAEDLQVLGGAGWVDQAGGIARIPIEDAITLYSDSVAAGRPLPMARVVAPAPGASPSPGAPPVGAGAQRVAPGAAGSPGPDAGGRR